MRLHGLAAACGGRARGLLRALSNVRSPDARAVDLIVRVLRSHGRGEVPGVVRLAVVGKGVGHGVRHLPAHEGGSVVQRRRVRQVVGARPRSYVGLADNPVDEGTRLRQGGALVSVDQAAVALVALHCTREVVAVGAGLAFGLKGRLLKVGHWLASHEATAALRAEGLRALHGVHDVVGTRAWNGTCSIHLVHDEFGHPGIPAELAKRGARVGRVVGSPVLARRGLGILVNPDPVRRRVPVHAAALGQDEAATCSVGRGAGHVGLAPWNVVKRRGELRVADLA
mmetsp:Transcript_15649/g.35586  ORF Transcript_15649/g.35586 Transcript_15649/m.35586 type:complete len:283 (-) Transcript_15649:16-864(-)